MPTRNIPGRALLLAALIPLISSCGSNADLRDELGLNRKAPDEFRVYSRPALTVPPEFTLRAPGTPSDAPTATPAATQARNTVTGDTSSSTPSLASAPYQPKSSADAQFLQDAGVRSAKPDVRSTLQQDAENGVGPKNNSPYLVNLTAEGDPQVDPAKEAERLKENKAQNKPATAGDTPVIEPKSQSVWGAIGDLF